MIALGLALVVGLAFFGARGGSNGYAELRRTPVAAVGKQQVTLETVELTFSANTQLFAALEDGLSPEMTAQYYAQSLATEVNRAAIMEIAARKGVELKDEQILSMAEREADSEIERRRTQLELSGKLKEGASQAELDKALRESSGLDSATLKKRYVESVKADLQNPEKRGEAVSIRIGSALMERFEKETTVSDKQLEEGFQTWTMKRVHLEPAKHEGEDAVAKMERILEEIKAGLEFEAAMEKYSDDPAPAGKPKRDATVDLARSIIEYDESYAPLLDLKAGDVSPVIITSTGPAIFKVLKIQPQLPADFATQKETYRQTRIRQMGNMRFMRELRNLTKPDAIQWKSQGMRALYLWHHASVDPQAMADKSRRLETIRQALALADEVVEQGDGIAGPRPAILAQYGAFHDLYESASAADKRQLEDKRIQVLTNVLEVVESVDLRAEVTKLQIARKNGPEATANLLNAISMNANFGEKGQQRHRLFLQLREQLAKLGLAAETDLQKIDKELERYRADVYEHLLAQAELNQDYSESGQQVYNEINAQVEKLLKEGWISQEQANKIEQHQKTWREEKRRVDKEEEEARRKAEEQAKKEAEEKSKREAEAAKQKPGTAPPGGANPLTDSKRGN